MWRICTWKLLYLALHICHIIVPLTIKLLMWRTSSSIAARKKIWLSPSSSALTRNKFKKKFSDSFTSLVFTITYRSTSDNWSWWLGSHVRTVKLKKKFHPTHSVPPPFRTPSMWLARFGCESKDNGHYSVMMRRTFSLHCAVKMG
jgi:hypothetical protein